MKTRYDFKVREGRCYIYVDSLIMFCFNQLDFKGLYAYKDDVSLYGLTIYLKHTKMDLHFKTKEVWLDVLKLLDANL